MSGRGPLKQDRELGEKMAYLFLPNLHFTVFCPVK